MTLRSGNTAGPCACLKIVRVVDPHFYIGSNEYLLWAPGAFNYDMGIVGNVLLDWDVNEDFSSFTFPPAESP